MGYRNMGDAQAAGAEARCAGAPKSDCLFLSRISTEPFFQKNCYPFAILLLEPDITIRRLIEHLDVVIFYLTSINTNYPTGF
jgi:hypothetical protein